MKIGIPKSLYYYFFERWNLFFTKLGVEVVSIDTNKQIVEKGCLIANDEMCLSLKIFLGTIYYLKDKCDYLLIPKIDNFGKKDIMCTNYYGLYDLVKSLFNTNILTFEINIIKNKTEDKGLYKVAKELGFKNKEIKKALKESLIEYNQIKQKKILLNKAKLNNNNKKILLVSHPYNLYDEYISKDIITNITEANCDIIYADLLDENNLYEYLSKDLYFKYSKEQLGAIMYCKEKIDGIIFLTTFPCGIDSLVNELVMRKINKPYLNLVIDDLSSNTGIITRIESFIDIIEQS